MSSLAFPLEENLRASKFLLFCALVEPVHVRSSIVVLVLNIQLEKGLFVCESVSPFCVDLYHIRLDR